MTEQQLQDADELSLSNYIFENIKKRDKRKTKFKALSLQTDEFYINFVLNKDKLNLCLDRIINNFVKLEKYELANQAKLLKI